MGVIGNRGKRKPEKNREKKGRVYTFAYPRKLFVNVST